MKVVSIFGSSRITDEHPAYQDAVTLGRLLAEAGYGVMTGGYNGIMEAISRGAGEAGGHVIGVTTPEIGERYNRRVNGWVKEEIAYSLLRERLMHLVDHADAYIAMPGGVGTFHEIAAAWEHLYHHQMLHRPLICYGDPWQQVIAPLQASEYLSDDQRNILQFANTPEAVISILADVRTSNGLRSEY